MKTLTLLLLLVSTFAKAAEVTVAVSEAKSDDGITISRTEDHKRDGILRIRTVARDADGDGTLEQEHVYLYRDGSFIASCIRSPGGSKFPSNILVDSASKIEINFQIENSDGRLKAIVARGDSYIEACMLEKSKWRLATDDELKEILDAMKMWKNEK